MLATNDGIASTTFGLVQRGIGARVGIAECAAALRVADAETCRDRALGRAQERAPLRRARACCSASVAALAQVGVGQHDGELFAAHATDLGARWRDAAQPFDEFDDHRVAGRMATFVIDALEMIDVEHDQRERPVAKQRLGAFDHGAPVECAGQRVMPRLVVEFGSEMPQLRIERREFPFLAVAVLDQPPRLAHEPSKLRDQHAKCAAIRSRVESSPAHAPRSAAR